eukprot:1012901-Pelagomonas_calceolata.AAC.1
MLAGCLFEGWWAGSRKSNVALLQIARPLVDSHEVWRYFWRLPSKPWLARSSTLTLLAWGPAGCS